MDALTEEQVDQAIDLALSRYSDPSDRIDWDDLLFRIEVHLDVDLPTDMQSAEIRRIKRAISRARKEASE